METYCFLGESKAPFCFNIRGARFWRKFSIFTSEKIHFKNSNMKLKNTSVYLLAGWMLAACFRRRIPKDRERCCCGSQAAATDGCA